MNVTPMHLSDLHASPLLQSRGGLCPDTVKDYTAAARDGAAFPALLAYRITDRQPVRLWLVAGFHRHKALTAAGVKEWDTEVREGTFADAWLAGWLSNAAHGLRYKPEDKRKAVEKALLLFREDNNAELARRLGVSHTLVGNARKDLEAAGKIEKRTHVTASDGASGTFNIKTEDNATVALNPVEETNDEPRDGPRQVILDHAGNEIGHVDPETGDHVLIPHRDEPPADEDVEPVYGEAWEPDGGVDTSFDFGANDGGELAEEPAEEPQPDAPPADPRKKLPAHFKPGNHTDPDHPFANILAALTHTTGLITRALNTPEGEKLRAYLSPLAAVPIPIKHVDFSSDVIKGDEYVAGKCRFVGHRALRHLVHLAGLPGRVKAPDAVLDAYRKTALTGDDQ